MSTFTPTGPASPSQVSVRSKTTPEISNITITLAATEQSIALPSGVIEFNLRARGCSTLKLSYTSGESGTNYLTIFPGYTYVEDNITSDASLTLYIQGSKTGEVLELWTWV